MFGKTCVPQFTFPSAFKKANELASMVHIRYVLITGQVTLHDSDYISLLIGSRDRRCGPESIGAALTEAFLEEGKLAARKQRTQNSKN